MEIFRIDHGSELLLIRKLEPHEVEGDKKFYFEAYGDPVLSADEVAKLAAAVAKAAQ